MGFLGALTGALKALAAYLVIIWPVQKIREITREIEAYEDEIFNLADSGSASDKLRIEVISKRKQRASEQLSAIRSSDYNAD